MAGDGTARGRRLRDRLPVRLRHHWKPVGALCAGLAVMVYGFGDARISPYVTSSSTTEGDPITQDIKGTVDLYDTSVAHSLQLEYDQTEFDKMMKEFQDDGNKEYIEADLTIDGVYLEDVGIRLKGNSTLMSLRGGGMGMPGGGRTAPDGATAGQGDGAAGQAASSRQQNGAGGTGTDTGTGGNGTASSGGNTGSRGDGNAAGPGGGRGGGIMQYDLSEEKPEELPWLIKIDEYVEGRAYQGEREISLRPGSGDEVPVNEALSLSLMDSSGLKNERYSFTELKVNGRPVTTRLMVENPDTEYAESVGDGNGVMYKARAGSSFDYQGDDPTDYESSFKQLNKVGSQDLEPVMKLIKWVDQASDEEFEKDLGKYVDVESLATYVAAQNLLLNFDDMSGPGKNYMLWYDLDTKKFTVLGWDYNLTFSGDATAGPDDDMSMGGMFGGGPPGGATDGAAPEGFPEGMPEGFPEGMPEGFPEGMPEGFPEGMPEGFPEGMPEGFPEGMPEGFPGGASGGPGQGGDAGQEGQGGGQGRGGMGGGAFSGHALKDRFLESDAFDAVYKKAYQELYEKFFGSGAATAALDRVADQAREAGADSTGLDSAVKTLRATVTERTEALAKDKEVAG
ncbi:CotH kinase family protein [Streptomyces sp. UH6]|uniref:CotH kinase family protein n=1 Tax=Streptomyces sp. UH6 TaxID=2748379 RepID=UPI0015D480CC|nr:CotH kinase family protein [Streptomyces sp. UH6]NYV72949.1 CotH kinase family protein [Streptomyces sp. UH6]